MAPLPSGGFWTILRLPLLKVLEGRPSVNDEAQGLKGRHSNLEIESGSHTFMVHRILLYIKPASFDRLCANQFWESVSFRITLEDQKPDVMACMRLYIYIELGQQHLQSLRKPDEASIVS